MRKTGKQPRTDSPLLLSVTLCQQHAEAMARQHIVLRSLGCTDPMLQHVAALVGIQC